MQVPPPENVKDIYDILFYETEWYRPAIQHHPRTRRAFGINTNIYKLGPRPSAEKRFFCCLPIQCYRAIHLAQVRLRSGGSFPPLEAIVVDTPEDRPQTGAWRGLRSHRSIAADGRSFRTRRRHGVRDGASA